ncbi:DMT family transporter [Candidatus Kuenenbacteria bacterium]|nr:DMT family transporter [Candidatus Kuenenbacteria bacterium]
MGVLLAFIAMLCWGLGDFLIQKSVRRSGTLGKKLIAFFLFKNNQENTTWIVLFYICAFGSLVLTPFAWREIGQLDWIDMGLLLAVGLLILASALLDFKTLKVGKISVVEPIFAGEIPAVLILTSLFLNEDVSWQQYILILVLIVGILLVTIKNFSGGKNFILEKGVGLAVAATIGMGAGDFLLGLGARTVSPVMANWFLNVVVTLATLVFLATSGQIRNTWQYAQENKKLIFFTCFFDNLAWVAYAYSMTFLPIVIATAISENYIAFGALLGFVYNKEKLSPYQWAGLVIAMATWTILAFTVS